jgi:hypothetical protein
MVTVVIMHGVVAHLHLPEECDIKSVWSGKAVNANRHKRAQTGTAVMPQGPPGMRAAPHISVLLKEAD